MEDPKAIWAEKYRQFMEKVDRIPKERKNEIIKYCLENYPTIEKQFMAFRVLMMKEIAKNEADKGGK